ncbi:HAD family hydrolase [Pseudonocardia sp. KRD-184]|uniref:HAD family hydrolase n=1 Tax=Pseudonocardia oceani TaxID=2792013 RepID=A0ABS6UA18_9PSEU|nr:HAD family hydrolase [Pseudonocardia oceani]MBW0089531.1 HAD family hydrolase [Pseudonocardia oceani]MBW0096597.1 HAD family hydrolase [Pseudonocardia oceani]MBW0109770.1 HAD family hydrolase [Pseudonocardia oceani]MBW0123415.1 HAD family hydrolase [Pseudonocardia oceani]MBW0128818.1 HAD family hydrolase [Pseudonocardia oceani]
MQAPRLVASDVDGTLLDPHDRVTPRAAAVIGRAVAAGVGFVLVTGRPPRWIPPVVAAVGVGRLAVCANGSVLYDAVEDRVLWSQTLEPAALAEIAQAVADVLPTSGLAVERVGTSAHDGEAFVAEPAYRHAWPDSDNAITERSDLLTAPAVKMLVRCSELRSEAMVAALAPVVGHVGDLTFSHPAGLVEISPPGVTKATGLAEVAGRLGVDVADVIAFGDMPNDLEMLRWAGHGVAMGNAHPVLHDVADEITATNGEDGLALVLERWF